MKKHIDDKIKHCPDSKWIKPFILLKSTKCFTVLFWCIIIAIVVGPTQLSSSSSSLSANCVRQIVFLFHLNCTRSHFVVCICLDFSSFLRATLLVSQSLSCPSLSLNAEESVLLNFKWAHYISFRFILKIPDNGVCVCEEERNSQWLLFLYDYKIIYSWVNRNYDTNIYCWCFIYSFSSFWPFAFFSVLKVFCCVGRFSYVWPDKATNTLHVVPPIQVKSINFQLFYSTIFLASFSHCILGCSFFFVVRLLLLMLLLLSSFFFTIFFYICPASLNQPFILNHLPKKFVNCLRNLHLVIWHFFPFFFGILQNFGQIAFFLFKKAEIDSFFMNWSFNWNKICSRFTQIQLEWRISIRTLIIWIIRNHLNHFTLKWFETITVEKPSIHFKINLNFGTDLHRRQPVVAKINNFRPIKSRHCRIFLNLHRPGSFLTVLIDSNQQLLWSILSSFEPIVLNLMFTSRWNRFELFGPRLKMAF